VKEEYEIVGEVLAQFYCDGVFDKDVFLALMKSDEEGRYVYDYVRFLHRKGTIDLEEVIKKVKKASDNKNLLTNLLSLEFIDDCENALIVGEDEDIKKMYWSRHLRLRISDNADDIKVLLDNEYKKPICIVADEFHLFIDEKNCEILRNFGQLARRIRKYTGSLIVASQSIEDFVGNSDILRHAKAIFNNCQYQMIGTLKEADMLAYLELFKENPLTDTQKNFLLKANQGEFLLNVTRKKRLRIKVSATPLEVKMMGEKQ